MKFQPVRTERTEGYELNVNKAKAYRLHVEALDTELWSSRMWCQEVRKGQVTALVEERVYHPWCSTGYATPS